MNRIISRMVGIIFCCCIMSGCGSNAQHMASSEVVETESGFSQKSELSSEEGEGMEEKISFVDVHGDSYEVVVNPKGKKNPYQKEGFEREGERLFYEDDNYTSCCGVDISKYQGEVDWEKVKKDGYDFAFIRLGFRGWGQKGALCLDEYFDTNIQKAQEAGLDVGVYFFSQAISVEEAREEAEFVIEHLKPYQLQLPVVYDPETIFLEENPKEQNPEARTYDLSSKQITENTKMFCEVIQDQGYDAMVYSNMLWEAFQFDMEELADYSFWYADYEKYPQTPYDFTFWQYTNEGKVAGISGLADINIWIKPKTADKSDVTTKKKRKEKSDIKVCIDAGHYKGASTIGDGESYGYEESIATLSIAKRLEDILEKQYGVDVKMTRTGDSITIAGYTDGNLDHKRISLRGEEAADCDLFVSLHTNANQEGANGYPTFQQPADINKTLIIANFVACKQPKWISMCNAIGKEVTKVNQSYGLSDQPFVSVDGLNVKEWTNQFNDALGVGGTVCKRTSSEADRDYYGVLRGASNVGVPGIIIEHGFHTVEAVRRAAMKDHLLEDWAEADAYGIAYGLGLVDE